MFDILKTMVSTISLNFLVIWPVSPSWPEQSTVYAFKFDSLLTELMKLMQIDNTFPF